MLVYPLAANSSPDFSQANPQQAAAVSGIVEDVLGGGIVGGSLMGPAGSGKTTTLTWIARKLLKFAGPGSVMFATPTHKSRKVLSYGLNLGLKAQVVTTARLIGRGTYVDFDENPFEDPAYKEVIKKAQKFRMAPETRFVKVIFFDESSMISQSDAFLLGAFCGEAGIKPYFVGDKHQLPPVKEKKQDNFDDKPDPDAPIAFGRMCKQFIEADGKKFALTTVERHKGAVLDFATEVVKNWEQEACFPFGSSSFGDSSIDVTNSESEWLDLFVDFVRKHKSNARAIFWTHKRIARAGVYLRRKLYGPAADEGWVVGELIYFPSYSTPVWYDPDSKSLRRVMRESKKLGGKPYIEPIYSATECEVLESEFFDLDHLIGVHEHDAPRAGHVKFEVRLKGRYQQITVRPLNTNMSIKVLVPAKNCKIAAEHRKQTFEQKRRFFKRGWLHRKRDEDFGQNVFKTFKDCDVEVYPLNTMTVHASQGSTFSHVFIHSDVLSNKDKDEHNAMIYVAATRAKSSARFLNPDCNQRFSLRPALIERHQQSHQPSQRNPSRLADTGLPDLSWFSLQ